MYYKTCAKTSLTRRRFPRTSGWFCPTQCMPGALGDLRLDAGYLQLRITDFYHVASLFDRHGRLILRPVGSYKVLANPFCSRVVLKPVYGGVRPKLKRPTCLPSTAYAKTSAKAPLTSRRRIRMEFVQLSYDSVLCISLCSS